MYIIRKKLPNGIHDEFLAEDIFSTYSIELFEEKVRELQLVNFIRACPFSSIIAMTAVLDVYILVERNEAMQMDKTPRMLEKIYFNSVAGDKDDFFIDRKEKNGS